MIIAIARPLIIIVFAMTLVECSTVAASTPLDRLRMVHQNGPPIEQNIVRIYSDNFDLNRTLGADVRVVLDQPGVLTQFRELIAQRIASDLAHAYGSRIEQEDQGYLLLARTGGDYLVYVVRIKNPRPDGAFRGLPGLVYRFPIGSEEIQRVLPTEY